MVEGQSHWGANRNSKKPLEVKSRRGKRVREELRQTRNPELSEGLCEGVTVVFLVN